jgi:hypothetical protein
MLKVADEQVEVFELHLFEAMQRRVERGVAAAFPELADIPRVVQRGIENAVSYDIAEGPDFAAFIALGLALRLTPPGPRGSWIYSYVNRPNTPGQLKLRMIESRLRSLADDNEAFAVIAQRMAQAREAAAP